jgi:hypothetical protein
MDVRPGSCRGIVADIVFPTGVGAPALLESLKITGMVRPLSLAV